MANLRRYKFLPILSGLLLGIGFLFPGVRFLSWFALVPLLFYFNYGGSVKEFFRGGFLAGFIFFGQVLIWYFNALPLDWFGVDNQFIGFCLVLAVWLVSVSFAASFFGFFGMGYRTLKKKNWFLLLSVPSLWIIFEYLKAWASSFLLWGDNSSLGPYWTFGHLGYLLSASPILGELAGFGGVYLLSFVIVLFNTGFYLILKKGVAGKRAILFLFLAAAGFFVSGYFPLATKIKSTPDFLGVAVINTQFTINQKQEGKFRVQQELLKEVAGFSQRTQFVIFPEGSQFLTFSPQRTEQFLKDFFPSEPILLIDVAKNNSINGSKNRITFFDTQRGMLGRQDKIFLMPFGEYQPYIIKWPAEVFAGNWLSKINQSRSFTKENDVNAVDFFGIKIGGLFCGDIVSPDLYRKLSEKSQIIFNVGNQSSFHGNNAFLTNQIQSIAQVRAAENSRYLARAANNDFSYIIDNKGRLIGKTEAKRTQVLLGKVAPLSKRSFYNKYGDWVLIFAFFFLLLTRISNRGIIKVEK